MKTFEAVVNNVFPLIISIISIVGITTLFGSVLIGIYKMLKRQSWKSIMVYGTLFGVITWISSSVMSFIFHFDPFESIKVEIPTSIIIAFLILILFGHYQKKVNYHKR